MAEQGSGPDEAQTELIPAVETGEGLVNTRPLPAVPDAAPDAAPDPVPDPEPPLPPTPMVLPPAAPPAPPPDAPLVVRRTSNRSPLRSRVLGALVVLLVAIVAVAVWKVVPHGSGGGSGAASTGSTRTLAAKITSFDPSGGSGLRADGSAWTTQTYRTATFGDLKKGVGLVLDLGGRHPVQEVRFTGNGETVQLRAADSASQLAAGFVRVGGSRVADGSTTLKGAGGGDHRFWMVWVSRLGRGDGGFSGRISDITVRGK